jgi:hypothetical protein
MIKAVLLSALGAASLTSAGPASPIRATITVGLRYDDCSALSPAILEDSILAVCARTGTPVTFGVVPAIGIGDNRKSEPVGDSTLPPGRKRSLKAAREAGILDIALHGYAHRAATSDRRGEFIGVTQARQTELIRLGLREIESFAGPVSTFIPPWNAYDAATLKALQANGFRTLSGDLAGIAKPGIPLRYVPATCLIPDLRDAVLAARRSGGGTVVAYFHPYEFTDFDPKRGSFSFADFAADLEWLAAQPDVRTATLAEIGRLPDASAADYRSVSRWMRLTPPFLEKPLRSAFWTYPRVALPDPGGWGGVALIRFLILGMYLPLAAFGFGAARIFMSFPMPIRFPKSSPLPDDQAGSRGRLRIPASTRNATMTRIAGIGTGFALAAIAFGIDTQSIAVAVIGSVFSGIGVGLRNPHKENHGKIPQTRI